MRIFDQSCKREIENVAMQYFEPFNQLDRLKIDK